MTLLEEQPFARKDVLPSWFVNAVEHFLSTAAPSFALVRKDATHIEVPADVEDSAAVVAIKGKWRWNETPLSRAHPGGAAGSYDIFATAAANKISVGGVDETNRAFGLRIVKAGETPPIEAGTVDIFRKVGSCLWDGAAITQVTQTAGGTRQVYGGKYVARAALAPETLTGAGTASWTNPSATQRALATFDLELTPVNDTGPRGCIINTKIGGVVGPQLFNSAEPSLNAGVRLTVTLEVEPGEKVDIELAGGGGVKASGIHVSYKLK